MTPIPFCKVVCDGRELDYLREVIESGWLTTAGKCAAFEERFAERTGARFAAAVNSATAALHLACEAAGVGPGDRVLVPTLTFTATAEVVRYLGAEPVFLDVEYGTGLLTPDRVEAALRAHPGVKALMLVHFGGQAADAEAILSLCRARGVALIEDAAHAFPARSRGRTIGTIGDATAFSFYANKTITTGEGGMLTTNDETLYRRVKIMRLHGINRDVWDRFTAVKPGWEYDVVAPGFKYNLPDAAAAIGLAQLERADEFRRERQRAADFYTEHLAGIRGLDLPVCRVPREDHAWHLFWIVLNKESPIRRDAFIDRLNAAGIGTSVHYKPLHRMTYYRDRYGLTPELFPEAERHWQGCVSLPLYPSLSDDQLATICRTVRDVMANRPSLA